MTPTLSAIRVYADPKEKKILKSAAKKDGRSLSNFLLYAGLEKAAKTLEVRND